MDCYEYMNDYINIQIVQIKLEEESVDICALKFRYLKRSIYNQLRELS